MSDILLLNPYYSQKIEHYSSYIPAVPLGLLYLASYLRKFGINCDIEELGIFDPQKAIVYKKRIRFGLSDDEIKKIIKIKQPKIVGITSMYSIHYRDVMDIASVVKKIDPKIKIVIGGNHPSSYWDSVLKDHNIDYVVIGEGELSFLELVDYILNKKSEITSIKGVAFRKGKKIIRNEARVQIKDLDTIPFPARDLMDIEKYFLYIKDQPYLMRYPATTIITSRGCPGHCVYCTVRAVWGRTWRARSPKNVVDEIEELVTKYGIKELAFLDDSASVNKLRWRAICKEILRRHLNIRWTTPNGIAHWTLDKSILKLMKKAGCYRVTFGIESGNIETRNFLGKPYSLAQAKELIMYANKIGMWTICTNIIGFPYEKIDSIKDTIKFAKESGTDFATFYLLMPQPTSDVYEYFKKEKLLNFDDFFNDLKINADKFEEMTYSLNETGSDTIYFKKEELRQLQKSAYRQFIIYRALSYLTNPLILLRKAKTREERQYLLRLIKQGIGIFLRTVNPLNLKSSDFLYQKASIKH